MKVYTRTSGVIDLSCPKDIQRLSLMDLEEGTVSRYRYGAQVPWTVYEHSLLVGGLAEKAGANNEIVAMCYMHDASEGLLGDMQKPIRDLMPKDSPWERAHAAINREIVRQLGVSWEEGWEECPVVRFFDHRAFEIEVQLLIPPKHWEGFFTHGLPAPVTEEERAVFESVRRG